MEPPRTYAVKAEKSISFKHHSDHIIRPTSLMLAFEAYSTYTLHGIEPQPTTRIVRVEAVCCKIEEFLSIYTRLQKEAHNINLIENTRPTYPLIMDPLIRL